MSDARERLEMRRKAREEVLTALDTFLASPVANDLEAILIEELDIFPLHRDTPEATAHAVGKFDVILYLHDRQQKARSEL